MTALAQVRAEVEAVYRRESRRILATLIRLLGDFDLAEEAMHDAFFIAVERWQRDGIPTTRGHGWSRPGASRPSMRCADAPASTVPRQT
jgi:predicted RNA polymerase sigma factor